MNDLYKLHSANNVIILEHGKNQEHLGGIVIATKISGYFVAFGPFQETSHSFFPQELVNTE